MRFPLAAGLWATLGPVAFSKPSVDWLDKGITSSNQHVFSLQQMLRMERISVVKSGGSLPNLAESVWIRELI